MAQDIDAVDRALTALQDLIDKNPPPPNRDELIKQYDALFLTYEAMVMDESHVAAAKVTEAANRLKQVVDSARTDPVAILSGLLSKTAEELNAKARSTLAGGAPYAASAPGPSPSKKPKPASVAHTAPKPSPALPPADAAMVPDGNPVPFAEFTPPPSKKFWPVITADPNAMVVSHLTSSGALVGSNGRRFLAQRAGGTRHHVGVDIYCAEGDVVIACAAGRIVNFYSFYTRPTNGEETFALFIAHDGVVCNYGEVQANARQEFGWQVGDTVTAGQRIARVSGTAMIHFETYVPDTTANSRWMTNGSRPTSLLNPTKLLLGLAAGAKRIGVDGGAVALGGSPAAVTYSGPALGRRSWHRHGNQGYEWRYDERGVYTRNDAGQQYLWRSDGDPVTCREIFKLYRQEILDAAARHQVNPALIMMTIATETAFARAHQFTGPATFRWEAHVTNTDVVPAFTGSYSAGPMQCLATTVREMLDRYGTKYGLTQYQASTIAPALNPQPVPPPAGHPLYQAAANIDIGTAEIRMRWATSGDDPILVAASFNAGGLYSADSAWGLRAQGDHLDRAARWYGDACEVLSENGIV